MYQYNAELINIVDGDTLHLKVDLGCDVRINMTVRLNGLNCPERGTHDGDQATEYVHNWFHKNCPDGLCIVKTTKDRREKYGRYLGEIFSVGQDSLNQELLKNGLAVPYPGGKA